MRYKSKKEAKEWSMKEFRGKICTTIPTFFKNDERKSIDEDSIRKMCKHAVALKPGGMLALGNVGEFFSLTIQERKQVAEIVVDEIKGRIPVFIQTATTCAEDCIELSLHAQNIGADVVCLLAPYFQAKSERAVSEWFQYVTGKFDIAAVLYNSPLSYPLSHMFMAKICDEIDNFIGIKNGVTDLMECREVEKLNNRIWVSDPEEAHWFDEYQVMENPVLFCSWVVYFYQTLEYRPIQDYTDLLLAGKVKEAKAISDKLDPHRAFMFQLFKISYNKGIYPISLFKHWLRFYGLPGGPVRTPLTEASPEEVQWLKSELIRIGLMQ
ncbi:MAG: dihydrodipicolinate synthase family protein [Deltaproteobacteria bacterium]|nr:dihydrodipicolinate synthase family protein [Deltaproteobacteria bacterium]